MTAFTIAGLSGWQLLQLDALRGHGLLLLGLVSQEPGVLLRRALGAEAGQLLTQLVGGQIVAVDGATGLLPPRFAQRARVDGVVAQLLYQLHYLSLGGGIIRGHGQGNAAGRAGGLPGLGKVVGEDVVEHLHDGAAQVLLHPAAFGQVAGFQLRQLAVAQHGVVVAGIDDGRLGRHIFEEVFRQVGNFLERDGHHDKVGAALGRFLSRDGRSARFPGQVLQRLGAAGIGNVNRMAEAGEPPGEGAADVAGADDSDVHKLRCLVRAPVMCRCRVINNGSGGFAFLLLGG